MEVSLLKMMMGIAAYLGMAVWWFGYSRKKGKKNYNSCSL
jgi:hypothetical protein